MPDDMDPRATIKPECAPERTPADPAVPSPEPKPRKRTRQSKKPTNGIPHAGNRIARPEVAAAERASGGASKDAGITDAGRPAAHGPAGDGPVGDAVPAWADPTHDTAPVEIGAAAGGTSLQSAGKDTTVTTDASPSPQDATQLDRNGAKDTSSSR
jgi:hypothetical protein